MSTVLTATPLYWYHTAIVRELQRLHRDCRIDAYSADGIASNCRFAKADAYRYLSELESAGIVKRAEARWDYTPDAWYSLV